MATQRQRIWGWWFFDWASQPYNTLLLTFIFGPYFAETARGYYMGTGMEEEAAKAAPPPLSLVTTTCGQPSPVWISSAAA